MARGKLIAAPEECRASHETAAIDLRQVSKHYRAARSYRDVLRWFRGQCPTIRALTDITYAVSYGQITGVLGLNGAGKTTLLKIICNLIAPDTGQVIVTGIPLQSGGRRAQRRIGYVPNDERSFFWRLSGWENLKFFASLHGLNGKVATDRIDGLLSTFGLADAATKRFQEYSSGMRKRLSLARALLHDPRALVLDEPTNSLDLGWDHFLRDYVKAWLQDQPDRRAVLWSTHRMEEARSVCDDLLILRNGLLCHRLHAARTVTEQALKDAVGLCPAIAG